MRGRTETGGPDRAGAGPGQTDRGDEGLDLVVTRLIPATRAAIWRAWAEPEQLKRWWAPAPLTTVACEVDLRPGSAIRAVMRAPDGTEHPMRGVFLEVVEPERIVFTDVLDAGWRPSPAPFITVITTLAE